MTTDLVTSRDQLQKRIRRFLESPAYARPEIRAVVDEMSRLGSVAIFGGALRDLALLGNRHFPSDVDIVVEGVSQHELERYLAAFHAARNKFGGYRFSTTKWRFDVWRLEETWAFRQHLVPMKGVGSLLATTFFDWDAIAYRVNTRELLISDDYLDRIRSRIVDVNLLTNPNPLGNALRALSIYRSGVAALAPRLARFVVETISKHAEETAASGMRADRTVESTVDGRYAEFDKLMRDYEANQLLPVARRVEQPSLFGA